MAKDDKLIERLKGKPTDFTVRELETLMKQVCCQEHQGGRGSGIRFYHPGTGRILAFDLPHPGKTLYRDQVRKVLAFLKEIGEL